MAATDTEAGPVPRPWRPALVAAVLALHLALFLTARWPAPRQLAGDEIRYWQDAVSLLAGEALEVDLLWPPLYTRFLALTGAGTAEPRLWLVELLQLGLLATVGWTLAIFARRRGLGAGRAEALGWAILLLPTSAAYAHFLWPEILHLALLGGVLVLAEKATPAKAALAGLLLGLALLAKSLLTPLIPLLILLAVATAPARRVWVGACLALTLALTLAPTLWRNHQATGRWAVADSSTFNLWVGLNDVGRNGQRHSIAWPEFLAWQASAGDATGRDAVLRGRIGALVAERGWPRVLADQLGRQYFRLFDWRSNLTEMLPGGAYHEIGQGFAATPGWLAGGWRAATGLSHFLLLLAFALGLATAPRPSSADPWSFWPWLFLAFNLAIFLLLHSKSRYFLQLLPMVLVLAGSFRVEPLRARRLSASILAALVLFLGFGGAWLDG